MAATNTGDSRQKVFFCDLVNILTLRRSMGRSMYSETTTRCTLNNTEGARALGLLYQWIYEDRILPTQADLDFFAGSDTNTSRIQLFKQGRYALLNTARYSIVQMRDGPRAYGGPDVGACGISQWVDRNSQYRDLREIGAPRTDRLPARVFCKQDLQHECGAQF